jgi:hypothetical protein
MKFFTKQFIFGVLVAAPLASVHALEFGANIELDTDMRDQDSAANSTYLQGGRVLVSASGRKEMGGNFISGNVEALFQESGGAATDNAYIMFGSDSWDIQAGRFEATNLFPVGRDTVLEHAAPIYEANMGRGRAGDDAGGIALHINASSALKVEIATIWGNAADGEDAFGVVRPSLVFGGDGFTLAAGFEDSTNDDASGFGITGNFDLGGANINVNFASKTDDAANADTTTLGANALIGAFFVGAVMSTTEPDTGTDTDVTTLYANYQTALLGIDGATITYALSSSDADFGATDDSITIVRVRLNYTF